MGWYDHSGQYVTEYHVTITGMITDGQVTLTKSVVCHDREVAIAKAAMELHNTMRDMTITDVIVAQNG